MREAIIFDLDGTLWDPTACACVLWNGILEKYSIEDFRMTRERVSGLMGKTMEEIGETLFPDLSDAQRKIIVDDYGDREVEYFYKHGASLYDGLEDTLKSLSAQYGLFIVSNAQDGYVQAFLHAHDLECYFRDIEMSGRTGLDKGSNIRLIIERNHCRNPVYVGDTAGDEKSARDAGIPFIWAKYGFGKAVSPDAVIGSISELLETLLNLS